MKLLALDTATEACSVALWLDGALHESFERVGRGHTERLLPLLHGLLAEHGITPDQLDGLVCGIGPGSFAGVRIGVGLAKGMALALDRPVVGVNSLEMLAHAALEEGAPRVLVAVDARLDQVYLAGYERGEQGRPQIILEPSVRSPALVPPVAGHNWWVVGSGIAAYGPQLRAAWSGSIAAERPEALPRAGDAIALALPTFAAGLAASGDELGPMYLRNKVALTLLEQAQKQAQKKSDTARTDG